MGAADVENFPSFSAADGKPGQIPGNLPDLILVIHRAPARCPGNKKSKK
jgi:hypothetical protein